MSYRSSRGRRSNRIECLYCGPSQRLPLGYDRFGSAYRCLRKGVGIGKFGERRQWQRRMGYPVDPEYIPVCPRLPARRYRSSSSDDSDFEFPQIRRGARSNRLTRLIVSRSGRYQYHSRSRTSNRRDNNQYRFRPGPHSRNRTQRRSGHSRSW